MQFHQSRCSSIVDPIHRGNRDAANRRALRRLANVTELFIFCDGAREASAVEGVDAVRDAVREELGFAATHIVCRDCNYGLARNITEGVSEVLKLRETVIVLEDDIVVSPYFLGFMNEALRLYRDVTRVGSISGYATR